MVDETMMEVSALLVVVVVAVPAVLLMCCILEECPLKSSKTFEDVPVFCGSSASDCCGPAAATFICLLFVAMVLLVSGATSTCGYMAYQGSTQVTGTDPFGLSFAQSNAGLPTGFAAIPPSKAALPKPPSLRHHFLHRGRHGSHSLTASVAPRRFERMRHHKR
mmetsp:Transcript_68902/g.149944  ORF Transcript_68902/g.149944 Transcript_68902/m.149944 type:complete len:163 (+) Transcript_68902:88-576(+)